MDIQLVLGIIIIAVAILSFVGYIAYKIKTKGLRETAIEFIVAAEQEFQKGQNTEKMEYVYNALVALLPAAMRIFITKQTLINFIQKVFDEIKVALDYAAVPVIESSNPDEGGTEE